MHNQHETIMYSKKNNFKTNEIPIKPLFKLVIAEIKQNQNIPTYFIRTVMQIIPEI